MIRRQPSHRSAGPLRP